MSIGPRASTRTQADGLEAYRRRLYDSYFSSHYALIRTPGRLSRGEKAHFDHHFKRHLPADHSARILDVGCGHGSLLLYLRGRGYHNVAGIDWSAEAVKLGRTSNLDVVEASAEDYLRRRVAELDVVFAVDVIEHVMRSELLGLLDAVYGALKPGGKFVLQVPNADGPFSGRLRYGDLTHEQSFTADSIGQALRVCGFTEIEVWPVKPAVHGAASALRWFLWQAIRTFLAAYLAAETGVIRGHVLSQNLIATAVRPRPSDRPVTGFSWSCRAASSSTDWHEPTHH